MWHCVGQPQALATCVHTSIPLVNYLHALQETICNNTTTNNWFIIYLMIIKFYYISSDMWRKVCRNRDMTTTILLLCRYNKLRIEFHKEKISFSRYRTRASRRKNINFLRRISKISNSSSLSVWFKALLVECITTTTIMWLAIYVHMLLETPLGKQDIES